MIAAISAPGATVTAKTSPSKSHMKTFRETVVDALERAIAAHRGSRVVVVCHGGVVNACAGHVLGVDDPFFLDVAYTGVSRTATGCPQNGAKPLLSMLL